MSQDALQAALAAHQAGRFQEAEAIYRQVLDADPQQADALQLLGYLAHQTSRHLEAVDRIGKAIALRPNVAIFHNNLALALGALGRWAEAEANLYRARELEPGLAEPHFNLGLSSTAQGRHADAVDHLSRALNIDPNHVPALLALASSLIRLGRVEDAAGILDRAIALDPSCVPARVNRGSAAIALGDVESAIAHYRIALAIDPTDAGAWDDLLLALHYRTIDPSSLFVDHVRWGRTIEDRPGTADLRSATPSAPAWGARSRDAERTLRIGYVSPDLRRHSVAYFVEPLLAGHDRGKFEVFCYSNASEEDEVSARFKSLPLSWRNISVLSDDQAAAAIRADAIDLLIDLAGHTGQNRLCVFALKPSPVQVSYLGYPNTTGLRTIDYRITDAIADPPGEADSLHTERLLRLPTCAWCYRPPMDAPSPDRTIQNGATFGSFNALTKVSPEAIGAWSRILHSLPHSRLILKSRSLDSESVRRRVLHDFAAAGVSADRLELLGRTRDPREHLEQYQRIDVALDTFPYNGTATTCEALWMGVPVVTLAGKTHASRVGASLLRAIGRGDCVCETIDDYVNTAVRLAEAPHDRAALRAAMEKSPLRDEPLFVAHFESAGRQSGGPGAHGP